MARRYAMGALWDPLNLASLGLSKILGKGSSKTAKKTTVENLKNF